MQFQMMVMLDLGSQAAHSRPHMNREAMSTSNIAGDGTPCISNQNAHIQRLFALKIQVDGVSTSNFRLQVGCSQRGNSRGNFLST